MSAKITPIVLRDNPDNPIEHDGLLDGEKLSADCLAYSDYPENTIGLDNSKAILSFPSEYYRDYNGKLVLWGDQLVTKKDMDKILLAELQKKVSNLNTTDFTVLTPTDLQSIKTDFNKQLDEIQKLFTFNILRLYYEMTNKDLLSTNDLKSNCKVSKNISSGLNTL